MEFDQKYNDRPNQFTKQNRVDWLMLTQYNISLYLFFFTVITGRISRPKTTSYGCTIWLRKRATPRLATDICAPLGTKHSSCWKNWKSPCWVITLAMKWRTQCAVPIAQTFHSWRKLSLFVRVRGGKWNVRVFFSLFCFRVFSCKETLFRVYLFMYGRSLSNLQKFSWQNKYCKKNVPTSYTHSQIKINRYENVKILRLCNM